MSSAYNSEFSISISHLHKEAYELKLSFPEITNPQKGSPVKFIFKNEHKAKQGTILDVFTKNSKWYRNNRKVKKLFRLPEDPDAKHALATIPLWSEIKTPSDSIVAVFDIKDSGQGYRSTIDTIPKVEEQLCKFFQTGKPECLTAQEKIQTTFLHTLHVDFLLCEGSLKRDLLTKGDFTQQQREYLNSQPGSGNFCQLTEIFMNAFKFGETPCKENGEPFLAEHYFKSISGRNFQPCEKSTVFYPPYYQQIYAIDGKIAQALASAFEITGGLDQQTRITKWDVVRKAI